MINNAKLTRIDDNGILSLIIEPCEGFKLRHKGDNTYSTSLVAISANREELLNEFIAVPIDEPDEKVEEFPQMSAEDDELTAEEALAIITGGSANEA